MGNHFRAERIATSTDVHVRDRLLCSRRCRRLRASERRWRDIAETAVEGIWAIDVRGCTGFVNGRMAAMLGATAETLTGRPLTDFIDAADAARLLAAGAAAAPLTLCYRRTGGRPLWLLVSVCPAFDGAGQPAGVLAMVTDITERRHRQTRDESHERALSMVAAGAPLADVMTAIVAGLESSQPDMRCCVMLLDPGGAQLRVCAAPSLPDVFNDAADHLPVGPGVASCGDAAHSGQRSIATDIQADPGWAPYRELAARAGVAACWSEPIRSREGVVLGTISAYHRAVHSPSADELAVVVEAATLAAIAIERKRADDAVRQSQKLESLGTLAGGIAHDFNNILGAILVNVALLRQQDENGTPAASRLEQIQKSALRARALVQQILAFSRRQTPQAQRRPLRPLLLDTLDMLRATLPAGVQLQARLDAAEGAEDASEIEVEVDGTQVQQVLMNLCTNAWHAMEGARGRIEIGLETLDADADSAPVRAGLRSGRCARLWVHDSGCGMDEATRRRIFEPFFTTKPMGQGTGLGLAVVHGIVAEHHGAILVDSLPGHGSTFHVYLPAARREAQAPVATPPPAQAAAAAGPGHHILLVDDDAVMLIAGQELLRSRGYVVTPASSGVQALAALRQTPTAFDAVVTDQNMPDCSGLELARLLRAVRPGLPVVICSGYIDSVLRKRAAAAGVDAVVNKEQIVEALVPAIENLLLPGG